MGTKQTRRTSADARTGPTRAPSGNELGRPKLDFKEHKGLRQAAALLSILCKFIAQQSAAPSRLRNRRVKHLEAVAPMDAPAQPWPRRLPPVQRALCGRARR